MGFGNWINKTAKTIGQAFSKGEGLINSLGKYVNKASDIINIGAGFVSDFATLGSNFFPPLEAVVSGANLVKDFSLGIKDFTSGSSLVNSLADAGKSFIKDELMSFTPGANDINALNDLYKRGQSLLTKRNSDTALSIKDLEKNF